MIILYFLYCKLMQLLKKIKLKKIFYETVFFKFFLKFYLNLVLGKTLNDLNLNALPPDLIKLFSFSLNIL